MTRFLTAALLLAVAQPVRAQQWCAQQIIENEQRAADPALNAFIEEHNLHLLSQQHGGQRAEHHIIPVVFHIIHQEGEERIAEEQVYDAMRILNRDFSATNSELDEVVSSFESIIGNADIEFRLATIDPDGGSTNGIEYIESFETTVGDDGSKLDPWPRNKYLNIWVTDVIYISGAAAYAYRPPNAASNPEADGVISNHRYVGSIGTSNENGSKTLTHEIGHYLNLPHTWGETNEPGLSSNCDIDDGINDTPNTIGVSNGGCNLSMSTCSALNNVQNFMDYASCEAMFTEGQVAVMQATLGSTVAQRSSLSTSSNLSATGVSTLTSAKFFFTDKIVCAGSTVQFTDESRYDATTWNWEFTGPANLTSSAQHPTVTFDVPGVYDVKLTVGNGSTTKTTTAAQALAVVKDIGITIPFTETFATIGTYWAIDQHEETKVEATWEQNTEHGNGDNFSYFIENHSQPENRVDDLILNSLDLRNLNSVSISFDVAYAQRNAIDYDQLTVQLSNDCGETWSTVSSLIGTTLAGNNDETILPFEPNAASDWKTVSVTNLPSSWVSANTILRFRFTSGGGSNLYLDNINVSGVFTDVPALVSPSNGAMHLDENQRIDWRSVPDVDSYEYEVDLSANFNSNEKITGTTTYLTSAPDSTDTEVTLSGLSHNTQYFWRVRSMNGSASSWSEAWSFTVAANGVGISEIKTSPWTIFPNPATESLQWSHQNGESTQLATLLTLQGAVVARTNAQQLDLSQIPNGIYMLHLIGSASPSVHRVVIQH